MLNAVKNSFKTIFINTLIIVLIGSFVLWGISGLTLGSANTAITVGDTQISASAFEKEYRNQIRSIQGKYGNLNKEQLANFRIADTTIAVLMRQALLDSGANELELYVSKKQLKDNITGIPAFKDRNGDFTMAMYRNVVGQNGFTVEGFENTQRGNIMRTMLQGYFIGNYLDDVSIERLLMAEKEVMDIDVVSITDKNIGKIKPATTAELLAYHRANANAFTTNETRDFKVLSLRSSELEKTATFSEQEAQALFDESPEAYIIPEKRSLEHILLFDKEEADAALTALSSKPNSFKTIAKKQSKDPVSAAKGGRIGDFTYEELADTFGADFSDTVFDLQTKSLSGIVKSDFGFHIVRVTKKTAEKAQSFAEVKASIIADEKKRLAEDAFFALSEKVEDDISGGLTLAEVAKEYKLPLTPYNNVTAQTADMANAAKIIPAAFSLEEAGNVSAALEVDNASGSLYVEMVKITSVRNLTLDEAKQDIRKAIMEEKTVDAMHAKANAILEAVKAGSNLKAAANSAKVGKALASYKNVARNKENAPQWMNDALVNTIFNLKKGAVLNQVMTTGSGFAVIMLKNRHSTAYTEEDKNFFNAVIANAMNDDLYQQYVNSLYEKTTVDYNEPLIQRIVDVVN